MGRIEGWAIEAAEAIFSQVSSRFLADSGSGGLANTSSSAYVRDFSRWLDPTDRQVKGWPKVLVEVQAQERGVPVANTTYQLFDAVVSFIVESDRDAGYATMNRVESRIRDRFHNATLSSLVDTDDGSRTWTFAPMGRIDPKQLPNNSPRGKTLRRVANYRVIATKGVT